MSWQRGNSIEQYTANYAVHVKPYADTDPDEQYTYMQQRTMFCTVAVIRLQDCGQRRNDCQERHCFVQRATDDQASGCSQGSREEVSICVLATAYPVELATIEFIGTDRCHKAPRRTKYPCDQFGSANDSDQAENAYEKAWESQQCSDNRTDINNGDCGWLFVTVLEKFVNRRILNARCVMTRVLSPSLRTPGVALSAMR